MRGLGILTRTLGDCILINTLSRNIKLKYPDMKLTWAIEEKYKEVIDFNPDIESRKIVLQNTAKDWDALLTEAVFYDKVFLFSQLRTEDGSWHQNDETRFQNLVDFYATRGNIELVDRKLYWYFDPNSDQNYPLKEGKKIFIHTTTLGDAKDWDYFKELTEELKKKEYIIYQVGSKKDKDIGLGEEFDLREKFTFQQLARLMQRQCNIFIGLDSGLSFMATAVGIPVICIMGASIPLTSGPFGSNVTYLEGKKEEQCAEKSCHALWNKCKKGAKCINNVRVDDVVRTVEKLMLTR